MKSNITQTEDKIQNPTTFGVPEMNKTTGQNTVVPVADVVNANKLNIKTPNLQPTALMSQNLVTMAQEQATKQTELDTIREQKKLDLAKQRSEQEGLVSLVSGQGTKIQTAYDEAIKAMSPLEKEISDLSNTINTRTSQFRNQMIDESGRRIAGEFVTGRQAIIQQRASAEIADLSATLDAKNGQLESAQRKLTQSMEIKQAVFKAEKEAQAIKVDLYKEITGETKEEEVNKLKELEKVEAKFEKEKDEIQQIALKALSEGAGSGEVQKIMNSKSAGEAMANAPTVGRSARLEASLKSLQISSTRQAIARANAAAKSGSAGLTGEEDFSTAGYAKRMADSKKYIDAFEKTMVKQGSKLPTANQIIDFRAKGKLPNEFQGEGWRRYMQAQEDYVTANLRKESGAAISDDEFIRESSKYFAKPGDGADVLTQKKQSRDTSTEALKLASKGGYEYLDYTMSQPSARASAILSSYTEDSETETDTLSVANQALSQL